MNAVLMTDKPRLKPHRWRWDGEEGLHIAVVIAKAGGIYFLNPSAALIFSACDGKRTVEELAGRLVETYGISKEQAIEDTVKVLDVWRELEMFETQKGPG